MIWLIICAALGIIFILAIRQDDIKKELKYGLVEAIFMIALCIFIGAFIGGISSLPANGVAYAFSHSKTEVTNTKLTTLSDNQGEYGSFFLGIGHIGSSLDIDYYTEDAGRFKPHSMSIDEADVTIVQDATPQTAVIEEDHHTLGNIWQCYFGPDNLSYVFHVPPGTVKQNYALDAQ